MKVLGIDVGGTYLKAVSFDGKVMRTSTLATPRTLGDFKKAVKEIVQRNGGEKIGKIGFGIPGGVEREKLRVLKCKNLPFLNGQNFKNILQGAGLKQGVDLKIDNDVRCHLNAELKLGDAAKYSSVVLIALGTGIGGGIAFDGKIYYGRGLAGELGKMVIDREKNFEAYAAGKLLSKFDKKELDRVAKYTGIACANVFNMLDPDVIILTGGVIQRAPKMIAAIRRSMEKHLLNSKNKKDAKLLLSKFKEFGGAIGAAWL